MKAQPGSPNWHWQQLGYTIERVPVIHPRTGKPTEYRRRVIRRPDGSVVEIDQRPGEDYAAAEVRVAEEERLSAAIGDQMAQSSTQCASTKASAAAIPASIASQ